MKNIETETVWIKKGLIYKPDNECDWWVDHAMAPAAFLLDNNTIRVYVGCWDKENISRIGFIDVAADNPREVRRISQKPVLNIGDDGCFDDNGVFPGHVYKYKDKIYLYYTGFQKLYKIAFSNFGGLAISDDNGESFKRVSKTPVTDRADDGLFTRAGNSIIVEDSVFRSCYSVGSDWAYVNGKDRPIYHVNYIESKDGINFDKSGKRIVSCDLTVEHGLGRPQICKFRNGFLVFYTRRFLDFKYHMGVAKSPDLKKWTRIDNWLKTVEFGNRNEFDSDMVYFPCFLDTGKRQYLFYVGNGYGKEGFGFAELK